MHVVLGVIVVRDGGRKKEIQVSSFPVSVFHSRRVWRRATHPSFAVSSVKK